VAAAVGLVLYFVGALVAHLRVGSRQARLKKAHCVGPTLRPEFGRSPWVLAISMTMSLQSGAARASGCDGDLGVSGADAGVTDADGVGMGDTLTRIRPPWP
jgi:hypothetical protein